MASLAGYFKQPELSDIDLFICLRPEPVDAEDGPARKRTRRNSSSGSAPGQEPLQLAVLPGHRLILFSSEYFKAQAQHWQPEPPPSRTSRKGRSSKAVPAASTATSSTQHAAVRLTIDAAEQLPAAEAVIAAMYGVPDSISGLEQQLLVHAVVIADMVHAETAVQQAVQALEAAAASEQGLSAAALQELAAVPAWPACLLKLLPAFVKSSSCCRCGATDLAAITAADVGGSVQRLLVAQLGDLEAVWADAELQLLLLALPLPAMQLLLYSDQLQVASEDTVLYTAQLYVEAQKRFSQTTAAMTMLAPLVRAPHLSAFALCWAVRTLDASIAEDVKHLLDSVEEQLRCLQSLQRIAVGEQLARGLQLIKNVPASWLLGPRQIRPLADGVRLQWRLPVEQLQQACRSSFRSGKAHRLRSPCLSPPMCGVAWRLVVICKQLDGGTVVGLSARIESVPVGMFNKFQCTFNWGGVTRRWSSSCLLGTILSGPSRLFAGLPPMAGDGWDEAAWAAAGLPTAGEMLLQLHVHSVE